MVSKAVGATMTEVTNSQENVNINDSHATDPRSTKQTVYQMKSSRTAMRDSVPIDPKI